MNGDCPLACAPAVREANRQVVGVPDSPKPPPRRITLTLPAVQRSREVWLVVSGSGKADAVAAAIGGAKPDGRACGGAKPPVSCCLPTRAGWAVLTPRCISVHVNGCRWAFRERIANCVDCDRFVRRVGAGLIV